MQVNNDKEDRMKIARVLATAVCASLLPAAAVFAQPANHGYVTRPQAANSVKNGHISTVKHHGKKDKRKPRHEKHGHARTAAPKPVQGK
jgi:hypothetical protein